MIGHWRRPSTLLQTTRSHGLDGLAWPQCQGLFCIRIWTLGNNMRLDLTSKLFDSFTFAWHNLTLTSDNNRSTSDKQLDIILTSWRTTWLSLGLCDLRWKQWSPVSDQTGHWHHDKLWACCGMRYDGNLMYSGIIIWKVTIDAAAAVTYHMYSKMAVI